jgi:pyruvate/2-oxoglutarate dehydrogenase complex dihydrolipoamide dehydrogenase (E3) component
MEVVCTGTRAVVPAGLAGVNPWTSRGATSAHTVPGRLAIVGGGVVGCEMATAWQALGARVTLLSWGRLLDRLPAFAGDLVAHGLRAAGAEVRTGVSVTAASRAGGGGPVTFTADDGTTLEADEVLAATRRAPRTEDIGLESVGLTPGSWLEVDDTMRVPAVDGGWLYAAGDVNHLALLTHMGKYQGRICGDAGSRPREGRGADSHRPVKRQLRAAGRVHRARGRRGGAYA